MRVTISMKHILWPFLALLTLQIVFAEWCAAQKIRVAVANQNASFVSAGVALKKNYWKEEGLEAEVITMRPPVSIAALNSREIDYTMVFGSVVRAAIKGLPVRVVASLIDGSTHALIVRPELKSARELKKRTVGVGSYGATDDLAGRMMLRHFGLDPEKDLKIVALGPDRARFAALREGVVDAVVVAPPVDAEAKKLGFQILARGYEIFNLPFVGLGPTVNKIRERPDEVKRTIKALVRANRFVREHREETVKILAGWGKTEQSYAAAAYDASWRVFNLDGAIPEDGLRLVIEQARRELKLARPVAIEEVADVGPLREAQRELGIRGR